MLTLVTNDLVDSAFSFSMTASLIKQIYQIAHYAESGPFFIFSF